MTEEQYPRSGKMQPISEVLKELLSLYIKVGRNPDKVE